MELKNAKLQDCIDAMKEEKKTMLSISLWRSNFKIKKAEKNSKGRLNF